MRRLLTATILAVLLAIVAAACGSGDGGTAQLEVTSAEWSGDQVTVEVDTNLPDGAVLSWGVFDGSGEDAEFVSGQTPVEAGGATIVADASAFSGDQAEVEVEFLPNFTGQPDAVDGWEHDVVDDLVARG